MKQLQQQQKTKEKKRTIKKTDMNNFSKTKQNKLNKRTNKNQNSTFILPRLPLRKKVCLNSHLVGTKSGECTVFLGYSVTLRKPYKFNCRTKLEKFFVLKSVLDGLFRISSTNFRVFGITILVPSEFQWISSFLELLTIHHNFSGKLSKLVSAGGSVDG